MILKCLGDFVNFKISRFRLSDVLDMMYVCINKSECSFVLCMISIVLLKFGPRLHDPLTLLLNKVFIYAGE
jgi:hypothetical protein